MPFHSTFKSQCRCRGRYQQLCLVAPHVVFSITSIVLDVAPLGQQQATGIIETLMSADRRSMMLWT
jgi:hypothetical protein